MNRLIHWLFAVALCVVATPLVAASAFAQSSSTLRVIFPFAAGGAGDAAVRLIADRMQAQLGRSLIVDNRTGAAGRIGVVAVKNAEPDGSTILFTPFAAVTIYPQVFKSIDYDPFTELTPIGQVCTFDFAIAVKADHPAKTPMELVAWLKANPAKAQFGSPGAGALPHFFGLLVGQKAGVEMTHIAYRGGAPAIQDLVAGQIPMVSSTSSDFVELHKAGQIRVIATSGRERLPQLPDVPTFAESGIDIVGLGWYAMFAPAKTPPDVIDRLNKALVNAINQPDVKTRLQALGFVTTGTTPQQLGAIQKADAAMWAPVIKASGFVAD